MNSRPLVLILIFLGLLMENGICQWKQMNGGGGGEYLDFAKMDGYIFAATTEGVAISTDNGKSWSPANNGLPSKTAARALAVIGSTLFAGTDSGGVFRTTDKGKNWSAVNIGLPIGCRITSLAVMGTKLFTGIPGTSVPGNIYVSSNMGATWSSSNSGLHEYRDVKFIRAFGPNLFAGLQTGIYLSSDSGHTWTNSSGLPPSTMVSIEMIGSRLFAGSYGGGVYTSVDGGASWKEVLANMLTDSNSTFFHTGPASVTKKGTNLFAGTGFYFDLHFGKQVLGGAVYISNDNGVTWSVIKNGLPERVEIISLAVIDSIIFAGTKNGEYYSLNNGLTWLQCASGLTSNTSVQSSFINNGSLFIGTNKRGMYKSVNMGQNWIPINFGLYSDLTINAFANAGNNIVIGTDMGVFISQNNGDSWSDYNTGLPQKPNILSLVYFESKLFASAKGAGTFVHENTGTSWNLVNTGLPSNTNVNSFAILGSNIFIGTDVSGAAISGDSGISWKPISVGLSNIRVLSLASNKSNVCAGTEDGIYFSNTLGLSWNSINNGFFPNTKFRSLFFSGNTLFAGTNAGAFVSQDNGKNWAGINTGLPTATQILAFSSSDSSLFAGTDSNGVWARPLSDYVGIHDIQMPKFKYANVKISKSNGAIGISYRVQFAGLVKLEIFNIKGDRYVQLVNGFKNPGEYHFILPKNISGGPLVFKIQREMDHESGMLFVE